MKKAFKTIKCSTCGDEMEVSEESKGGTCWRCTHKSVNRLNK